MQTKWEMKGAMVLPRNEDTFWFDTAVALMKGKEQEILAEKGDIEGGEDGKRTDSQR